MIEILLFSKTCFGYGTPVSVAVGLGAASGSVETPNGRFAADAAPDVSWLDSVEVHVEEPVYPSFPYSFHLVLPLFLIE